MALPTSEELGKLPRETLIRLWVLTQEFKRKMMAQGCMPASAIDDLAKAVPDDLVRNIVADNRRGVSAPSGLIPDEKREPAAARGTGWQKPVELGLPPGTKYVDQLCDVQDAIDKAELRRRLGGG